MGLDFLEILNAWMTSANPNDLQKELAEKRLAFCSTCDFKKEVLRKKQWSAICGGCGCPISKKIFTDQYGSCPLHKWESVEDDYKDKLKVKKRSII